MRKTTKPKKPKSTQKSRSVTIVKSGYLFIATNFILGFFNIIVGVLSGSIAITSDAIHSFIDSVSGLVIIVSEKLASHQKFSEYRNIIERITTIIIAVTIIITGIHIILESIELLQENESPNYSIPAIIVLISSILLKYVLAKYLKQTGKTEHSVVLVASGAETINDMWISIVVLVSVIIFKITGANIEPYVSIVIAIIIIKVGLEFIFPSIFRHHHHHLESSHDHRLHKTNIKH